MRAFLEQREALLREQIKLTNARLAEFAEVISKQGITVEGSRRGTLRPHPLLKAENEVRRERARVLRDLQEVLRRLEAERMIEAANALRKGSASSAE